MTPAPPTASEARRACGRRQTGFALVVALVFTALAVVLVLGLLTLSVGQLRSTDSVRSREVARANARLALAVALADLQKAAGPDQRITAEGAIFGENTAHPHVAGVWRARQINPAQASDEGGAAGLAAAYDRVNEKSKRFVRWLASTPGHGTPADPALRQDFARLGDPARPAMIALVDSGSLGRPARPADRVEAGRLDLKSPDHGAVAWAVMDLGTKARLDIGRPATPDSLGLASGLLGTGSQPGLWHLPGLEKIDPKIFDLASKSFLPSRWPTPETAALSLGQQAGASLPAPMFFHDFTVDSLGLPVDVTRGGPKLALDLLAAGPTPPELAGRGIYATTLGLAGCPSDPTWDQLLGYARLPRQVVSDNGCPTLTAQVPAGWSARRPDGGANTAPPPGPVVMPVVAKVQMVFSVLARDLYSYEGDTVPVPDEAPPIEGPGRGGWGETFVHSSFDYMLHLLYTPVVTLYNPYNVTLECDDLRVEFANIPFSLQVFRNDEAQTKAPNGDPNGGLVPLNRLYGTTQTTTNASKLNKRFTLALREKDATGAPAGSRLRLAPGEVRVFSPYIDPGRTWAQEIANPSQFYDYWNASAADNRQAYTVDPNAVTLDTSRLLAVPGWPGPGVGFDIDWLCPSRYRIYDTETEGKRSMARNANIPMRAADRWAFEFSPLPDALSGTRFTVETSLRVPTDDDPEARVTASVLDFDLEKQSGLVERLLAHDPLARDGRLRYPRDGTVGTLDLLDHAATPIRDYLRPRAFALFSAYAKTTRGGQVEGGTDGRYASMPWAFTSPVGPVCAEKILSDHPALHSHELDFISLEDVSGDAIQIDPHDRGSFITAHRGGLKLGTHSEIPLAPVQTLPGLNGANLAGTAVLPRFAAPLGNSFASPLLGTGQVLGAGPDGTVRADHSFLLNTALFDHCYFSGLADQTGGFLPGLKTRTLAAKFFGGGAWGGDPRIVPLLGNPAGREAVLASLEKPEGAKTIALRQGIKGAFNIHSTSVNAWKAVLSSLQASSAPCLAMGPDAESPLLSALPPTDRLSIRFSRFRLPNAPDTADSGGPSDPDYAYWQAPRHLTEAELDRLARAIVKQVRLRGPFLSLGEFVNRRIATPADTLSLRGALQAAIDEAGLNEGAAAAGFRITEALVADYGYATPEAAAGPSALGAPGFLTQADVLAVLGNAATVRSDTFRVRACGQARDAGGRILAGAFCEAVLQRLPEYLDPSDPAQTSPNALTKQINRTFGRRFVIRSMRWLAPEEI